MSGPRYSIIPQRFFKDARPHLSHTKVIGVLGTHSNETGWCRLKQRSISDSSALARETVNRAIADLIEWGYVEKRDVKGRSSAYRLLMDSSASIPDDLPELDITCDPQITPPCDVRDHKGCDLPGHKGCDVRSHNKNDPSLTINTKRSASEASNLDLKAKGAKPALVVERSDSQFAAWMAELRNRGLFDLAERHEAAGEITVTSRWPSTTSEVLSNPKPVTLSERSKAMTGGR